MEDDIIRQYPKLKDTRLYEHRYSKEDFDQYNAISIENYEKWKKGINFKTNRKLKIGGKTHEKIGYENFHIRKGSSALSVIFTELDAIDSELYLQETDKLKREIDDYNSQVFIIIDKINLLEKWNDYIEFEGLKYGILNVYKNIHRENDCLGLIKEDYYEDCKCNKCDSWNGIGCAQGGKQYYKCEKCGYKYSEKKSDSSKNYKGK